MSGLAEIIHLRTPSCRQAAASLPALAAGEEVEAAAAEHVEHCLRCQAEAAVYRRLVRTLRALREEEAPAPPGGLGAVLAALEAAAAEPHASSSGWVLRAAYLGGITFATAAAGAAGVLVWMNRRRLNLADAS